MDGTILRPASANPDSVQLLLLSEAPVYLTDGLETRKIITGRDRNGISGSITAI
jgi:hypothetical protein